MKDLDFCLANKTNFVLLKEGHKFAHNFEDVSGQVFGCLTAIKPIGYFFDKNKKRKMSFLCLCVCGSQVIARTNNLKVSHKQGRPVSCGCKNSLRTIEFNKLTKTKMWRCTKSSVLQSYKAGAKSRKIPFLLTKDSFYELTQQNCFYCERPPSMVRQARNGKLSNFIYNGIDRVDSSKGYTKDNCVSCCKLCNKMKLDFDLKDWLSTIEKIATRKETILNSLPRPHHEN
jgi:hypothetical protein